MKSGINSARITGSEKEEKGVFASSGKNTLFVFADNFITNLSS